MSALKVASYRDTKFFILSQNINFLAFNWSVLLFIHVQSLGCFLYGKICFNKLSILSQNVYVLLYYLTLAVFLSR